MPIRKNLGRFLDPPTRWAVVGCLVLVISQGTALGISPSAGPRAAWALDADGNGLDDALERDLAAGRRGPVELFIHYDRRPTDADAKLLVARGAIDAYVFHNWDLIQISSDYSKVRVLLLAPGVVGVERFDPPVLDLDASARAVRVRPAAGVPVVDGIDHSLAVQTLSGGPRGAGMVIAIIDTGVDNTHEALDDIDDDAATNDPKLVQRIDPTTGLTLYAGVSTETKVPVGCIDPDDDHGHGTSVAGIALGTGGAAATFQGMAPQARLVDVDVGLDTRLNHPAPSELILGAAEGLDWILDYNAGNSCYGDPGLDRIDVVSMSLGSQAGSGSNPNSTFNLLVTDVVRSGVALAQSAGNWGPGVGTLGAGAEGAILVANALILDTIVRSDDLLRLTSSRGPRWSDNDADALDELRPDITAPGHFTRTTAAGTGNGYHDFTGTSAAAPHIAGIMALLLQVNPGLRPVDQGSQERMGDEGAVPVRDVLQQTAQFKTAVQGGVPVQVSQTGKFGQPWNNGWGYGLVDAYAAVCLADPTLSGCG